MKAIDFACRLLKALNNEPHSDIAQRVLLAVAAGLEFSADIAQFMGLTPSGCSLALRRLANEGLLTCICGEYSYYRLTPQGKQVVAGIFSFLPRPR